MQSALQRNWISVWIFRWWKWACTSVPAPALLCQDVCWAFAGLCVGGLDPAGRALRTRTCQRALKSKKQAAQAIIWDWVESELQIAHRLNVSSKSSLSLLPAPSDPPKGKNSPPHTPTLTLPNIIWCSYSAERGWGRREGGALAINTLLVTSTSSVREMKTIPN